MKKSLMYITTIALLTGCGSSSDKTKIDIASYLPIKSVEKSYLQTTQGDGGNVIKESVTVADKVITIKGENNVTSKTLTIEDDTIIVVDKIKESIKSYKRNISVGSNLYSSTIGPITEDINFNNRKIATKTTKTVKRCNFEDELDALNDYSINYSKDILKFKCTEIKTVTTKVEDNLPSYITLKDGEVQEGYNVSYFYLKKDIGLIADINDNCIVQKNDINATDDRVIDCIEGTKEYSYKLLLGV